MASDRKEGAMELKPLYSIAELSELFRLHRNKTTRILDEAHIEYVRSGRKRYVPAAEIEERLPRIWDSIRLLAREDSE